MGLLVVIPILLVGLLAFAVLRLRAARLRIANTAEALREISRSGDPFQVIRLRFPEEDPDGISRGLLDAVRALTEREDLLGGERRRLSEIVNRLPTGVVVAEGRDGTVVLANDAAFRLLGRDLEGLPASALSPLPLTAVLSEGRERAEARVEWSTSGTTPRILLAQATRLWSSEPGGARAVLSFWDVTELETARRRVEEANAELDAFTYIVSHDLKEPLRGIENFAKFLWEDERSRLSPTGTDHLARISNAAERLKILIEELLRLSRAGQGSIERESVEGARLVADAKERVAARAAEVGGVVTSDDLPVFRVSRVWAVEALANLLANALKYGGPKPRIHVRAIRDGEEAGLSVTDSGSGVSPEEEERVFELFRRGSSASGGGTGAGLAIVRKVAQSHGGRAWAKGPTFFVTFGRDA